MSEVIVSKRVNGLDERETQGTRREREGEGEREIMNVYRSSSKLLLL